jgi:hypothetical protein
MDNRRGDLLRYALSPFIRYINQVLSGVEDFSERLHYQVIDCINCLSVDIDILRI